MYSIVSFVTVDVKRIIPSTSAHNPYIEEARVCFGSVLALTKKRDSSDDHLKLK